MSKSLLTPVVRNDKFYSEEDFQYELDLIEEFIEEDLNQSVVVYEVDRTKINTNAIYNETKENIRFKSPKEIPCMFEVKEGQIKSHDSQTTNGVYAVSGNLELHVPVFMLEKYNCDIKRGDYIGVQIDTNRMFYFSVTNDGKINIANTNYVGSYKTAWLKIEAAPVPESEFNGK